MKSKTPMEQTPISSGGFSGMVRRDKTTTDEAYAAFLELDCRFCQAFGRDKPTSPLVLVDVGARGGFDSRLSVFGEHVRCLGFEPDPAEAERIQAQIRAAGKEASQFVHCAALWKSNAVLTLHVPHCKESTSVFEPNMAFFGRLPEPTANAVASTTTISATTLDECDLPTGKTIDILKLDIEGAELAVLQGASQTLHDEVLAVIPEVTFVERYVGQPFFADVDIYLRGLGFELFDLKLRRWRRKPLTPVFKNIRMGQLVYGDALYLKDPINHPEFCSGGQQKEKLLKLIAIAEFYSLPDYGIELLEWGLQNKFISDSELQQYRELLLANEIVAKHNYTEVPKS